MIFLFFVAKRYFKKSLFLHKNDAFCTKKIPYACNFFKYGKHQICSRNEKNQRSWRTVRIEDCNRTQKQTALVSLDVRLIPEIQWNGKEVIEHPEKFVLNTYINRIKNTIDSRIIQWTNDGSLANMSTSDIKAKYE